MLAEANRRLDAKIVEKLLQTTEQLVSRGAVPSPPETSTCVYSDTTAVDSFLGASDPSSFRRKLLEKESGLWETPASGRDSAAIPETSEGPNEFDRESGVHLSTPPRNRRPDELAIDGPCTDSEVFLHVYDLHPLTRLAGLSIFHVGVEVHGCEVSYGASGLHWGHPGCMGPGHREVLPLGPTRLTKQEVVRLGALLSKDWSGSSYKLLSKNCQTFCLEFCRSLGVPKVVPAEYVRFAHWA